MFGTLHDRMQSAYYPHFAGYPADLVENGGYGRVTQMGEWVGIAMSAEENGGQMYFSRDVAQNKKGRCNTGAGTQASFASLSLEDKLLHRLSKLENLEQSNKSIENIAQDMNQTKG